MTLTHQQQVTAVVGFVHHVTGNQQSGAAVGQIMELAPQIRAQHRVETHRRFVQHEQLGPADQRAGQRYPGALASGKVSTVGGAVVGQPHQLDSRVGRVAVEPVQRREVADVVDDSQVVVNGRVLRHVSDASAQHGRPGRPAQDCDPTCGDDLGADDAAHQGGLAAAGRTEQAGDGAARNLYRKSCSAGLLPRITRRCLISTAMRSPLGSNSSLDELIIR